LTQGQFAFVDEADFEQLNQYPWYARWAPEANTFYASRWVNGKNIHMHNVIVPPGRGRVIDHWNGYGLDNRRINLRRATPRQNAINRERTHLNSNGCTGIGYDGRGIDKQWFARISVDGKRISLGYFERREDAIAARLSGERRYYRAALRVGSPEIPPVIIDPNVSRAMSVRNTSGFVGVSRKRKGWRARVRIDGIEKSIGHFDSPEKASEARETFLLNYRKP
jgi:hypothetical protein